MLYMFVISFFSSPILGVKNEIPYSPPPDFACVSRQNRAAGGRDATHLPKRCYGHLQPLQPTFVPVAIMISICYYHVVKKPDIHYSSRFQQGMCQAVVVLTWLKIT